MMGIKEWTKLLFLFMYSYHVSSAHPCGENPLRRLERILNEAFPDTEMSTVLSMLRDSESPAYRRLQAQWREYANCVGNVDTGYFKRSNPSSLTLSEDDDTNKDFLVPLDNEEADDSQTFSGQHSAYDQSRISRLKHILTNAWKLKE